MSTISEASVPTTQGLKYLQQLCKHWAHNLAVILDETSGRVIFPANARGADWPADAIVTLDAEDGILVCTINASAEGQRDGLKGALERHIDRFAFREVPLTYNWANA